METYVFKIFVQSNELITETFSNQKAHWKNISDAYFLCWETFFFFTKIYADYLIKVFKFGEIILFLCIVTSFYHMSSIYIHIWITLQWKNPILEKDWQSWKKKFHISSFRSQFPSSIARRPVREFMEWSLWNVIV
jgi:hypothetical protein